MMDVQNVLRSMQKDGLLEMLKDMNKTLDLIQKSLESYLEDKRREFPRFYFLSNADLLDILGQSRDPQAVQPHLKKCFDNIDKLKLVFPQKESKRPIEAQGMFIYFV